MVNALAPIIFTELVLCAAFVLFRRREILIGALVPVFIIFCYILEGGSIVSLKLSPPLLVGAIIFSSRGLTLTGTMGDMVAGLIVWLKFYS